MTYKLENDFKRYTYNIGDKVVLNYNPCSAACGCFWTVEKADFLIPNKVYEIEDIVHFGGGCPPVLLSLRGVKETTKGDKWWETTVPANWFKPVK